MSTVEAEKKVEEEKKAGEKGGELLFCGATCWDIIGRKKGAQEGNLVSPTRLRPLVGVNIRFVASGSASCHCVALDVEGRCYTWGRNERGQLGHGDTIQRDRPTVVSELSKYKLIKAGAGRSHTVVVTEDGLSLAFGWNKHGQLGSGSARNEIESSPVRCLVSDVKTTACGADFTVWLSSVEGASILSAGLPQYGQLGHGTDNEYNTKDSSVRLAYEAQPRPRALTALARETIVKVACGTNHTVAVDSNGYVYTWGFGGYGRLGHREQKDEWVPRRVDVFSKNNVLPPDAVISAGSVNSACTAGGGQLYMWGKIKNTGDDWMYPKPLMDLSGWNLRCMDSGNMHHFVGADNSCISWGHAQNGELGYGPSGQKSSAVPKKVDILEGMHVIGVACGMGHSMVIVDRMNVGDRLDQLDVYDGKASGEGSGEPERKNLVKQSAKKSAAKASDNSRKRKSKDSSESEDEENGDDESDASEDQVNGQTEKKSKRGGKVSGRGQSKGGKKSTSDGKSTGRGRGRPLSGNKSTVSSQEKAGKRGRPRKS
ncbi:PREDICTED: protein RCC2 homolog [Populus euphratica]|uniref:Protein RCC2 homolog n=1 Tax=Populus euphratica TaxID=75702 RepID=A0AAJ6UGZ6_POPEU|nr:PREDICTED: protein RCC2 homolog [Populus euphratica]